MNIFTMNYPARKPLIKVSLLLVLFAVFTGLPSCSTDKNGNDTATAETATEVPTTSLHEATFLGDTETVQAHIAAGTDLNQKDEFGSTALHVATTFGKTEVATALIAGGADLNILNGEGSTALHTAAFLCRTTIAKDLLEKGVDASIQNNYGSTALQSVAGPFAEVKVFYDELGKMLGPYGLKLDYEYLEETRPVMAEMIKNHQ